MKVFAGFMLVAIFLLALVGLGFDQPFVESSSWSRNDPQNSNFSVPLASVIDGNHEEVDEVETSERIEEAPNGTGPISRSALPPIQLRNSSSPIVPTPGSIQFSYPDEMRPVPDSDVEAATAICITGLVFALVNHSHDSQITNYVTPEYSIGSANFIEVDTHFGDIERSEVEPQGELLMYCGALVDEGIYNTLAQKVNAPPLVP